MSQHVPSAPDPRLAPRPTSDRSDAVAGPRRRRPLLLAGGTGLLAVAADRARPGRHRLGARHARSAASPSRAWPRRPPRSTSSPTSPSRPRRRSSSTRATPPPRDNFGPDRHRRPPRPSTRARSWPTPDPSSRSWCPGVPLPPAPVWPVQATSEYPQTPNSAATDEPGVNMDAHEHDQRQHGHGHPGRRRAHQPARRGDPTPTAPSGSGNPLAGSSALVGVGTMSAHVVLLGPEHHRDRRRDGHRRRRLAPRRVHHHRLRHLDRDGQLGRDDRQADRLDPDVRTWTSPAMPVTINASGIEADGRRGAALLAHLDDQHAA